MGIGDWGLGEHIILIPSSLLLPPEESNGRQIDKGSSSVFRRIFWEVDMNKEKKIIDIRLI